MNSRCVGIIALLIMTSSCGSRRVAGYLEDLEGEEVLSDEAFGGAPAPTAATQIRETLSVASDA